jgi:hypothetical protein
MNVAADVDVASTLIATAHIGICRPARKYSCDPSGCFREKYHPEIARRTKYPTRTAQSNAVNPVDARVMAAILGSSRSCGSAISPAIVPAPKPRTPSRIRTA